MFPSGSLNRSSKGANGQEFCLCEDIASTRSVNGMLVWTGPLRYESPASGSALTGGTLLSLSPTHYPSHIHITCVPSSSQSVRDRGVRSGQFAPAAAC